MAARSRFEVESTLTDRYQTTVPETVRRALKLGKRDKETTDDPVLGQFLGFLAQDIANNPRQLRSFDKKLVDRINKLVGDKDVDLDQPLSEDDD